MEDVHEEDAVHEENDAVVENVVHIKDEENSAAVENVVHIKDEENAVKNAVNEENAHFLHSITNIINVNSLYAIKVIPWKIII